MSFWTTLIVIVAIIALTEVIKSKHRAENGISRDFLGNEEHRPKEDPETRREIEELRERIKVLERIATDGNSIDAKETKRIAAEIEALRDEQAN